MRPGFATASNQGLSDPILEVALNPAMTDEITAPPRIWRRLGQIAVLLRLLTIVFLLGRKIPFRRIWVAMSTPFRPVHLQPLNPPSPH